MSTIPKRPPRPSRPRSCVRDDESKSEQAASDQLTPQESQVEESCSTTGLRDENESSCQPDLCSDYSANDATSVVQANESFDVDPEKVSMDSDKPTVVPRTEVKYRKSTKSHKAPPVPPPPRLSSGDKIDSGQKDTNDSLSLTVQTSAAEITATDHIELAQKQNRVDESSMSPQHSPVPSTQTVTADTKPALKPKPSGPISRDTLTSVKVVSSSTASVNTMSNSEITESVIDSTQPTKMTTTPIYSVVNKSRKPANVSKESTGKQTHDMSQDDGNKPASSVTVARSKSAVTHTSVPPKKPPRTFAHTEYMRLKSLTLPHSSGGGCVYEEVTGKEELRSSEDRSGRSVSPTGIQKSVERNCSGEVTRRRQVNDKLPAPPRPPPPAFPDNKPSPPLNQTDGTKKSSSFRCSDDEVSVDRRRPERSSSMLERSDLEKRKAFLRPSDCCSPSNSGDDDIYAVPSEVTGSRESAFSRVKTCIRTKRDSASPSRLSTASDASSLSPAEGDACQRPTSSSVNKQQMRAKISNAYSILRLNAIDGSDEGGVVTDDDDDGGDNDNSLEAEIVEHRDRMLRHVATTRQHTRSLVLSYAASKLVDPDHLFEMAAIVDLQSVSDSSRCVVHVVFHYPQQPDDLLTSVAQFCFPDASVWRPVTIYDGETFMFILNDAVDGCRKFHYCRRFLPSGSGNRLPQALCVVSKVDEWAVYEQLLLAVENRLNAVGSDAAHDLLRTAYDSTFPLPNHEVHIRTAGLDGRKMISIKRGVENQPDTVSYELLLSQLSHTTVVHVFASLLLERRVIFCAQQLSTLVTCIRSMMSLLYPFKWPHTLITVLPCTKLDTLNQSSPFVIGILASTYAQLLQSPDFQFDNVIVVDIDGGKLLHSYGDEQQIIPRRLQKALIVSISDDSESADVRDATVSEAFVRFFVETCGHYTDFVCTQQDGQNVFERESFVKAVSSSNIRVFLEWFTSTQMFEVFLSDKLAGRSHPVFESRIAEYREEMNEFSSSLRQNVKNVGKKLREFLVESGSKIKKKLQRNVFV